MTACGRRGREFGKISQARTLESEVRPLSDKYAKPRKLAPWLEAERYFKRYRDTQKVTLPRMQMPMLSQILYSDGSAPITPMLTQDEGCGKVNS